MRFAIAVGTASAKIFSTRTVDTVVKLLALY